VWEQNAFAEVLWSTGGVQMCTAAKYKRHAADCLRLARLVSDSDDKALLTEMAAMWLRLADRSELMSERAWGDRVRPAPNGDSGRETGEGRS
jgi:hypothetical protein